MIGYDDMEKELADIVATYDGEGSSSTTDFLLWDAGVDPAEFRRVAAQGAAMALNVQLPGRLRALGYAIDGAPPEALAVVGGTMAAFFESGFVLAIRLMQKETA